MQAEQPHRHDRGTVGFCLAFIGLGAFIILGAQAMTPLGAVFPRTIGVAMVVLAAVLLVATLVRRQTVASPTPGSGWRRIALVVIMGLWVAILPVLGFFAASGLAFVGLMLVANYAAWTWRRALLYGVTAVALLAGFYGLFVELLHVPAPRGLLF